MDSNAVLQSDPILSFFLIKLKFPRLLVIFLFFFAVFVMIVIAVFTGVWSGIDYSLSKSYATWIGSFFLCISNIYIIKYYYQIPKVFSSLKNKKIITDESESYELFLDSLNNFYKRKYKTIFFIFCLCLSFLIHLQYITDDLYGWTETKNGIWSLLGIYNMVLLWFALSIFFNFIINVKITIRIINQIVNKIHKKNFNYNFVRLCSHNTGGLKPLGDLAMVCNLVLICSGIYVSLLVLTIIDTVDLFGMLKYSWQIIESVIPVSIYLLISISIFYFHIKQVHHLMRIKKVELLESIRHIDRHICKLEKKNVEQLLECKEKYEILKYNEELFDVIKRLPTWPFNFRTFSKLAPTVLLPLIPIIAELIIRK